MKRRGFFRCALALVGLKAIGADSKLLPNPDWVDAEPEGWTRETQYFYFCTATQQWTEWKDGNSEGEWVECNFTENVTGEPCDADGSHLHGS